MNARAFQVHQLDNVATLVEDIATAGTECVVGALRLVAKEPISRGHKIALRDLAVGDPVTKFGVPIGHATQPIVRGAWVHLHNLASDLDQRSASLDLHSGAPSDTSSAYV